MDTPTISVFSIHRILQSRARATHETRSTAMRILRFDAPRTHFSVDAMRFIQSIIGTERYHIGAVVFDDIGDGHSDDDSTLSITTVDIHAAAKFDPTHLNAIADAIFQAFAYTPTAPILSSLRLDRLPRVLKHLVFVLDFPRTHADRFHERLSILEAVISKTVRFGVHFIVVDPALDQVRVQDTPSLLRDRSAAADRLDICIISRSTLDAALDRCIVEQTARDAARAIFIRTPEGMNAVPRVIIQDVMEQFDPFIFKFERRPEFKPILAASSSSNQSSAAAVAAVTTPVELNESYPIVDWFATGTGSMFTSIDRQRQDAAYARLHPNAPNRVPQRAAPTGAAAAGLRPKGIQKKWQYCEVCKDNFIDEIDKHFVGKKHQSLLQDETRWASRLRVDELIRQSRRQERWYAKVRISLTD